MILDPATFENPEEYKMLPLIMDRLEKLEKKNSSYLAKVLTRFNKDCLGILSIADLKFREKVIGLFKGNYRQTCRLLLEKGYESYLVEHLENFFVTKLKKIKEKPCLGVDTSDEK